MSRQKRPDLSEALTRFHEGLCLLECAIRSLKELQDPSELDDEGDIERCMCAPEIVCLTHTLELLQLVHGEVDRASS